MRVVVGRIGRPHGIRGEVTVETRTDEPEERFAPGAVLLVESSVRHLVVDGMHWHSGRLLLSFEGVHDRTAAEGLRGLVLEVERADDEAPEDPEEFYDSALIGCVVELVDGTRIGTISEIAHLPGQDLLVVDREPGELLVPFVEQFVPQVDVSGRRIVITPPTGLLDDAGS
jgi:16S rRNA processing protein RimM